jgi:hypothetical protein
MHAPRGCSGVQALPNNLQSVGILIPLKTSPQEHPPGSFAGEIETSKTFSASNCENSFLSLPAFLDNSYAAPICIGRLKNLLKNLIDKFNRLRISLRIDHSYENHPIVSYPDLIGVSRRRPCESGEQKYKGTGWSRCIGTMTE